MSWRLQIQKRVWIHWSPKCVPNDWLDYLLFLNLWATYSIGFCEARFGIQDTVQNASILDPESWIQDPGSWILDPGSWILYPGWTCQKAEAPLLRLPCSLEFLRPEMRILCRNCHNIKHSRDKLPLGDWRNFLPNKNRKSHDLIPRTNSGLAIPRLTLAIPLKKYIQEPQKGFPQISHPLIQLHRHLHSTVSTDRPQEVLNHVPFYLHQDDSF